MVNAGSLVARMGCDCCLPICRGTLLLFIVRKNRVFASRPAGPGLGNSFKGKKMRGVIF